MKGINNHAPATCRKSITIKATKEKVWQVLTDINGWVTWNTAVSKAKCNGELKAQTTFDWKTGGVRIHSTLHIVEPFQNFGWTGKALGAFAIHNWTLQEKNARTEVTVEESMDGFLVKLFKTAFSKNLENGMQNWLALLRQECEK